jgi:hypothetical protein
MWNKNAMAFIFLEGLKKKTRIKQDIRWAGKHSNQEPPKYKSEGLQLKLTFSVWKNSRLNILTLDVSVSERFQYPLCLASPPRSSEPNKIDLCTWTQLNWVDENKVSNKCPRHRFQYAVYNTFHNPTSILRRVCPLLDNWLVTAECDSDKGQTRPVVRVGAPYVQDSNCQTGINIWS